MEVSIKTFDQLSASELYDIMQARFRVFVLEQHIEYLDPDGVDRDAIHVCYRDEAGAVVAYLRVIPAGKHLDHVSIGRLLTLRRHQGLGRQIMLDGMRVAIDMLHATVIEIDAQLYIKDLYTGMGFVEQGDIFMEAGIEHVKMFYHVQGSQSELKS